MWQPKAMAQDYGQLLKACARRAQWTLALHLLNDLKLASIISNIILYSAPAYFSLLHGFFS